MDEGSIYGGGSVYAESVGSAHGGPDAGVLPAGGGGAAAGGSVHGGASVLTGGSFAPRVDVTCEELEIFHDCGCPKVRECVCYIYTDGCGKCGECLKNLLYSKETGNKGTRICKLAVANVDEINVGKFKVEYPRHLIKLSEERARAMGHNVRMLRFVRKVFDFALDQQAHELKLAERDLARRTRLNMAMNDPLELMSAKAFTSAYYDTDLIHGHAQRIRKDAVWAATAPLIAASLTALSRVRTIRAAISAHWRPFAAFHITRVGRGFAGRCAARNRRLAVLRHFASLRIQAAYRGFHDRKHVIPTLRGLYELRAIHCIQRAWRRYRDVRTFRWRAKARLWRLKARGATKMAAVFRGWLTRKYLARVRGEAAEEKAAFEGRKAAVLAKARARREAIRTRAATTLQRLWRGVLGRRAVYARRGAGVINNGRVKELTDKFLASGDLWGFIAAVNGDYNLAERDKSREITRAKAFVDQVIRVREEKGERAWRQWQEFKASGGGGGGLGAIGDRPPSRLSGVGSIGGGGGAAGPPQPDQGHGRGTFSHPTPPSSWGGGAAAAAAAATAPRPALARGRGGGGTWQT